MSNTIPIGSGFRGINRSEAPHLLEDTESPQATDFAALNEVVGAGGNRYGRKRVASFGQKINGVVPFNIVAQGRVVSYISGTWSPILVPWTLAAPNNPPVFDQYDIQPQAINANAVGDFYSNTWNITPTAGYTNIVLAGVTGQSTPNIQKTLLATSAALYLEGFNIFTSTWQKLAGIFAANPWDIECANTGDGTLTAPYYHNQMRLHVAKFNGAAETVNFAGSIYFVNGSISYEIDT